ncbi:MAG: hypothetical protein PHZ27_03590 [Candidatus Omnitrophica bacterium]|nr:hypothetical protein [Candidatus Omnitrophota bacterium]
MRNKKAISIIEVLLAVFIFSICTVLFFPVFFSGMSAICHLKNRLKAEALIDRELFSVEKKLYFKKSGFQEVKTEKNDIYMMEIDSMATPVDSYGALYKTKFNISWDEGRTAKTMRLNRNIFINAYKEIEK